MIIGSQTSLKGIMQQLELVSTTDSTVLILGETGTGKEVIARHIHQQSSRQQQPFIRVNCGAISSELIDSELFGHEKGSFTGATSQKRGWFEQADGGTLFLDEVAELSLAAQVRLLRVIQEGSLRRVGSEQEIKVDVRVIAATHKNLAEEVQHKRFREDLLFRLNVFPVNLPPLRQRLEDISALSEYFATTAASVLSLPICRPTQQQIQYLQQHSWPGNVRELQGVIERAAILGRGQKLAIESALFIKNSDIRLIEPEETSFAENIGEVQHQASFAKLDEVIIQHINQALRKSYGRVEGPFGAAKLLGINPSTLRSKIRKYGINPAPATNLR
ncbi:sigma-54-dependent Fis family transcriptional regulator [Parashewanella curva]|uniref:Sigma-54-dependent Fis family transcriptional regulator n=1 Tax=Parashewanella curva TaxID=2338552 RepID=A0A3L8PYE4_9GAMM|nr:sigma-54 dependent transcriptional regulator [Parashewanella curva]RLV59839.1 sigma-54-dependent Fis family transcriptional regulator [Parashewanella curva]